MKIMSISIPIPAIKGKIAIYICFNIITMLIYFQVNLAYPQICYMAPD